MTTPTTSNSHPASRQQNTIRSLLAIADRIRGTVERDLATGGITFQQYNVLRILADAGPEGLPTLEVAERLVERTPGITRLIDRLECQGLVARQRGRDRRLVLCSITGKGASLLDDLSPRVRAVEEASLACLNPNELGALNHFLNRIRVELKKRDWSMIDAELQD